MSQITKYLKRCLELASLGQGKTSPAPLVGWVMTDDQKKILEEGWFPDCPLEKILRPKLSSDVPYHLYLNNDYPLSNDILVLLASYGISNIYLAAQLAEGCQASVNKHRINYISDCLKEEEHHLNRRFYFSDKKRPYVILKWAETKDGFIAKTNYDSKWISNATSCP